MEQRRRWEQGHLGLVCSQVPRLTVEAIGKRDLALMALVLDLSVLPLALFGMTLTGLFAAALAFWFLTGAALPVWLAGSALTALLCAVVWAWAVFGRDTVSMAALAAAPLYALAKIPLYLSLGFGKRTGWVRSRREGEHESKGAR